MKYLIPVFIFLICSVVLVISCKKYVDKPAVTDPRLTNPYCNDPNAVNYNWGFPGKPDSAICFYPSDLFRGRYVYTDSVSRALNFSYVSAQIDTLVIYALSLTKIAAVGLCTSLDSLKLTAGINYVANLDTTMITGQQLCRIQDTVNGTITKDQTNDSVLFINFTVYSDTGISYHSGRAVKH